MMAHARPRLIYDGRCAFCKIWVEYWNRLTGDRVEYVPSQNAGESIEMVRPDGSVSKGARAVFEALGMEKTYESSRLVAGPSELLYRFVARHRGFFYHLTRLTFGTHIEPARFVWTQWIFLRLLALIYASAFASLGVQIRGLIGANGILPLHDYLDGAARGFGAMRFFAVPTVFWWNNSDEMLSIVCWAGVAFSVLLFFGRLPRLMLAILFILYLSLSSAGQDFLAFQWDSLLMEVGFLAIFLGRARIVAWLFRWLVFRLYFLSGSVKLLSHDPTWRNLTALTFHYHTQPLPVALAWYADKLPLWFQRGSTLLTLVIEIGVPFLIFAPRRVRMFAAGCMIVLQTLILLTGNYAFFNFLTIALCIFLFDDQALRRFIPGKFKRTDGSAPKPFTRLDRIGAAVLVAVILTLGVARIFETFFGQLAEPLQFLSRVTAPFEIVNSYGLFAVMTTTRLEIVVEGSRDGENWLAYEFPFKPGDLDRAPRWAAPYQPRLDWQMWFAALSDYRANIWFLGLAARLLEGSPPVLALMEKNPFPEGPPRYVRAMLYEYSFTDADTRRHTGAWWKREPRGTYLPAIGLRSAPPAPSEHP